MVVPARVDTSELLQDETVVVGMVRNHLTVEEPVMEQENWKMEESDWSWMLDRSIPY